MPRNLSKYVGTQYTHTHAYTQRDPTGPLSAVPLTSGNWQCATEGDIYAHILHAYRIDQIKITLPQKHIKVHAGQSFIPQVIQG